ncbi:hypothetical protein ACFFQF_13930 [Haladaptatus pallidirubidus]|uniref:Glycosyltransferase RgtA/B/C/D-like domain-containing protein n=1 Tax=Haladaptatus pallidirubidus TaxID=1008152 RepID=A0AAV3UDB8_9EURY|nr:hypothetical protein [Haladaptatus pallidirubidus]
MARTVTHRLEKSALVLGFLALTAGVLVAHESPARAYELSIYRGTPALFWVGIGFALLTGVAVAVSAPDWYRSLALALGGMSVLSVASLPVIRGYHFYGAGDSLTHLGWARDIVLGTMEPYELLYPGTHTVAVVISELTGLPLRRALLVMVSAFVLVFLLFVPLSARVIADDDRAVTFAALAGFLLLPINAISVFAMPHPTSQAIMFLPFVIFLLAKYVTATDGSRLPLLGSSAGTLLALASIAIVFVHPQQAANAILLFGGVVVVQFVYRLFRNGHAIARHRTLYGQTVFLALAFLAWTPLHERSGGTVTALITSLFENPAAATDTTNAAASLSQLGGSIRLLFMKLFLVGVLFSLFAGIFMLGGLLDRVRGTDASAFSKYVAVGMIPLTVLFGAFFAASLGQFHFRILGFMMVPVTILGGIALARGVDALETRVPNDGPVAMFAGGLFAFLLVLSLLTVFHSPYMYQASGHVSESQMTGYETAFDNRGDAVFTGLRSPGERYSDGILGYEESREASWRGQAIYGSDLNATGENFTARRLATAFEEPRYLPVTDSAKQREIDVFGGLRFPREGFRTLDSHSGVSRVQSGGGFDLYYIE